MVHGNMTATAHPDDQDAVREALEAAASDLENRAGNTVYRAAWKVAAKLIRARKPKTDLPE